MDYYKLGQQIRKYRKMNRLSQEQLAEKIGISVTHMSHIETGNTKLSLQVFVDIARTLEVRMDDLFYEKESNREVVCNTLAEIVQNCTTQEICVITDVVKAAKIALEKYMNEK